MLLDRALPRRRLLLQNALLLLDPPLVDGVAPEDADCAGEGADFVLALAAFDLHREIAVGELDGRVRQPGDRAADHPRQYYRHQDRGHDRRDEQGDHAESRRVGLRH